eukprot:GEZU01014094.1.p1 GENE.GEZU01014094.1~~GEZU01014094.1.p1  ORF type:complete len:361 (-),score=38.77 GEZU01014094.1:215-1297(-)
MPEKLFFIIKILHRTLVIIVYLLIAALHFTLSILWLPQWPIVAVYRRCYPWTTKDRPSHPSSDKTSPRWHSRSELHFYCTKITFYCMYTFFVPEHHRLNCRFDFHHMSYGLASILIPFSRPTDFGKWMVFDELVGYDQLGVFGRKQQMAFVRLQDGRHALRRLPAEHYPWSPSEVSQKVNCIKISDADGVLEHVSSVHPLMEALMSNNREGESSRIRYDLNHCEDSHYHGIFPSDNFFVWHMRDILCEILYLTGCHDSQKPFMDVIGFMQNRFIDELVRPTLDLSFDLHDVNDNSSITEQACFYRRDMLPIYVPWDIFRMDVSAANLDLFRRVLPPSAETSALIDVTNAAAAAATSISMV